jgi:WS/DGAT/MGAT family acyltransferase
MIAGVSGVDRLATLMDPEAEAEVLREEQELAVASPRPWFARTAPSGWTLLADEGLRRAALPLAALRAGRDAIAHPDQAVHALRDALEGVREILTPGLFGASQTPLNDDIGPHRRFDWFETGIADTKDVRKRLGGTLNDVVLTVVAGALGSFLRRRRVNVDILDFIAAIPVNVRAAGDHSLGNHVAAWLAKLPIAEREARARFEQVVAITTALKRSGGAAPTGYLYELAELGGRPALSAVVELTRRLSPCNIVVTNVPGPPFPLYMLDAKMLLACPQVTLLAEQGLGIAIFSYLGTLHFGFNADWDLLPDLHDLVADVTAAFGELADVAGVRRATDQRCRVEG